MDEYFNFEEAKRHILEHGEPPPRPRHLKGRAIGMWYSRMNKVRKSLETKGVPNKFMKPVGDVSLSRSQRSEIKSVLNDLQDKAAPSCSHHRSNNSFQKNPGIDVKLSRLERLGIKNVLDNVPSKPNVSLLSQNSNSYQNIGESQFKTKFLDNINGKLEDHIDDYMETMDYEQDSNIDKMLYDELQSKHEIKKFMEMWRQRSTLPAYRVKDSIINMVTSNQVILISGETGCGKTTQVPQFLLDYFIENKKGSLCKIICTQPRRISAISVAERVASERAESCGHSTGYQIRLEKVCPRDRGSVTFCTTGVILRQMQSDPCLSEYTHIIIDEIHERDIQTDFLLTLLKQVITKRADLRVILMSATLNAESFSNYFGKCPHLNIPGFTYHVEEYFLEDVLQRTKFKFDEMPKFNARKKHINDERSQFYDMIEDHIKKLQSENKYDRDIYAQLENLNSEILNIRLILTLLIDVCNKERDQGAVLIFVPGLMEISDLHKSIESSGRFPKHRFLVIPLHSLMPTVEQRQVFDAPPAGVRKIIIATNIAETSITIDDVVFVIDCGRIKIKFYDPETNTETLESKWVAKANASQRKGRAGRVKPGVCFHLISRARYQTLEAYILPEILRTRLENVILTAKILQLGKIEDFFSKLMDSPDPDVVQSSLDLLKRLETLDDNECLTPLGYHLAKLPMNPQIGKMLLFGALFNCLEPILNVAVALDFKDPFLVPLGKEREADRKKKEFGGTCQSDHILIEKLIYTFENLNGIEQRNFCWEYFVSMATMNHLLKLKRDFMANLYELRFVPSTDPKCAECNINSDKVDLMRAVICAGLYPNIAKVRDVGRKKLRYLLYLPDGKKVHFHPKSILNGNYFSGKLLAYYKMVKSTKIYIHDATPVDPLHVIFFGDNFQQVADSDKHFITINNSLKFNCHPSTSDVIKQLRAKLNNFLEFKISHPNVVDLRVDNDETVLFRTIIQLLNNNEIAQYEANDDDNEEEDVEEF